MFSFFKRFFPDKSLNAAHTWQQAGNETLNAFWIFALPVHLILQRDTFSLAEPAPLTLLPNEIDSLSATLNTYFNPSGRTFFWHEDKWLIRLEIDPQINTVAPQMAINKDIRAFLPTGEGAKNWASFMNEVQMLFFEHSVNLARESENKIAINSLWCYGLGQKSLPN